MLLIYTHSHIHTYTHALTHTCSHILHTSVIWTHVTCSHSAHTIYFSFAHFPVYRDQLRLFFEPLRLHASSFPVYCEVADSPLLTSQDLLQLSDCQPRAHGTSRQLPTARELIAQQCTTRIHQPAFRELMAQQSNTRQSFSHCQGNLERP
jgi:hypothetical protein